MGALPGQKLPQQLAPQVASRILWRFRGLRRIMHVGGWEGSERS